MGIRSDDSSDSVDGVQGARWNEAERAALEEGIAARRPFLDFIYGRTNVDGSKQYFQMSGEPILDTSGCYIEYRGIGMDVTGRMRPDSSEPT